jgi:hypothetical protein
MSCYITASVWEDVEDVEEVEEEEEVGSHQLGALRRFVHVAMRLFSGDI